MIHSNESRASKLTPVTAGDWRHGLKAKAPWNISVRVTYPPQNRNVARRNSKVDFSHCNPPVFNCIPMFVLCILNLILLTFNLLHAYGYWCKISASHPQCDNRLIGRDHNGVRIAGLIFPATNISLSIPSWQHKHPQPQRKRCKNLLWP
jgi:hypothetical protein